MNVIPEVPTGLALILALIAPYAVAVINNPNWSPAIKKVISVVVTAVFSVIAIVLYYASSDEPPLEWPAFVLLFIVVSQALYALVLKPSVKAVESAIGTKGAPIDALEPVFIDPDTVDFER